MGGTDMGDDDRDLFEKLAAADIKADPVERARASMKRVLPKRFYSEVGTEPCEGGYRLLIDDKPVRTPARHPVVVAGLRVAAALEAEWADQGDYIDPAKMPLTRLVNSAIDGVATETEAVKDEIARFAMNDLLFYRAEGPERLVTRQKKQWDPVLSWVSERLGIALRTTAGIVHVAQDERLAEAVRTALPDGALALAAMHTLTTITGSALLALAVRAGRIGPEDAWTAAHIDEDWNAELWGMDAEAAEHRAFRRSDFDAALVALDLR